MEAFVEAVDAGSFAAAAAALRLSPQMVGRHVSSLEERLGVRLLNRSTRGHSLTEAGAIYLEGCRRALAQADLVDERVAAYALAPRGTLRVTAPVAFGSIRLVPDAERFLRRFPEVQLHVELTDRRCNLIEEGYDAAIRIGALPESDLISRALAPYRLLACAAPAYLSAHGAPTEPDELAAHRCLRYSFHPQPAPPLWRFGKGGVATTVDPRPWLQANDMRALIEAALRGAGIVLAAEHLVAEHLASGRLTRILDDYETISRPMHLLFARREGMAAKLRAFIDWAGAEYGRPTA